MMGAWVRGREVECRWTRSRQPPPASSYLRCKEFPESEAPLMILPACDRVLAPRE